MNKIHARLYYFVIALFVLVFCVENTYIISFSSGVAGDMAHAVRAYAKHIAFYFFLALAILALPEKIAFVVVGINQVVNIFIHTYNVWLNDIPTVSSIMDKTDLFKEVETGGLNLVDYIDLHVLLLHILTLILYVICIIIVSKKKISTRKRILSLLIPSMACVAIVLSYAKSKNFNVCELMPEQDIVGNISRRGYLPIWAIEAFRGVEWQGQFTCRPRIAGGIARTEAEAHRKIVYIQVESLDYDMIGCAVGQKLVMPFLTRMANEGALFKLYGQKIAFSSNSDYELLCTRVAKPPYIAYKKIESYTDSIPYLLKESGLDVKFFHGWSSSFQSVAYQLMGGETFFPNDMQRDGYVVDSSLTMPHVTDADVFKYAAAKIAEGRDAFFHVIMRV